MGKINTIRDLSSQHRVRTVTDALTVLKGMQRAKVNLHKSEAIVQFDASRITAANRAKKTEASFRIGRKIEPLALKFIVGTLIVLFSITGCSDMPYTGSVLPVNEVDRYLVSTDGNIVCFQDGIDSTCIKLGAETGDGADTTNGPAIHIYPERRLYLFYHEGNPIVGARRVNPPRENPPPGNSGAGGNGNNDPPPGNGGGGGNGNPPGNGGGGGNGNPPGNGGGGGNGNPPGNGGGGGNGNNNDPPPGNGGGGGNGNNNDPPPGNGGGGGNGNNNNDPPPGNGGGGGNGNNNDPPPGNGGGGGNNNNNNDPPPGNGGGGGNGNNNNDPPPGNGGGGGNNNNNNDPPPGNGGPPTNPNGSDGHGWILWVYYPDGIIPRNPPTLSESGVTITINGKQLTDEDITGFAQFIGPNDERGIQFFYPTESAELFDLKVRIEGLVDAGNTVKFNINYLWKSD